MSYRRTPVASCLTSLISQIKTRSNRISKSSGSKNETYGASEAFVTGTFGAQTPVREIDGRIIGDKDLGPVTEKIQFLYKELIERETLK